MAPTSTQLHIRSLFLPSPSFPSAPGVPRRLPGSRQTPVTTLPRFFLTSWRPRGRARSLAPTPLHRLPSQTASHAPDVFTSHLFFMHPRPPDPSSSARAALHSLLFFSFFFFCRSFRCSEGRFAAARRRTRRFQGVFPPVWRREDQHPAASRFLCRWGGHFPPFRRLPPFSPRLRLPAASSSALFRPPFRVFRPASSGQPSSERGATFPPACRPVGGGGEPRGSALRRVPPLPPPLPRERTFFFLSFPGGSSLVARVNASANQRSSASVCAQWEREKDGLG